MHFQDTESKSTDLRLLYYFNKFHPRKVDWGAIFKHYYTHLYKTCSSKYHKFSFEQTTNAKEENHENDQGINPENQPTKI